MSLPDISYKKPGTVASATTLNTEYAAIATETGVIDGENIRTEGLTRAHFTSLNASTGYWVAQENTGNATTYTNSAYAVVGHGIPMRLLVNNQINAGDVVRIHANVYISDCVIDGADTTPLEFRFQFFWDIGAGYVAIDTMEFPYGGAVKAYAAPSPNLIKNRRMGFSYVYVHTGAPITIANIETRVRVLNPGGIGTITLRETNSFALIVRG